MTVSQKSGPFWQGEQTKSRNHYTLGGLGSVYLMGKKTMSPRHAAPQIMRNLVANAVKIVWPEPWVDRRGRFLGNMRAVVDLVRGRLSPQNVNALE